MAKKEFTKKDVMHFMKILKKIQTILYLAFVIFVFLMVVGDDPLFSALFLIISIPFGLLIIHLINKYLFFKSAEWGFNLGLKIRKKNKKSRH